MLRFGLLGSNGGAPVDAHCWELQVMLPRLICRCCLRIIVPEFPFRVADLLGCNPSICKCWRHNDRHRLHIRLVRGVPVSVSHLMRSRRAAPLIRGRQNGGDDKENERGRYQQGRQGVGMRREDRTGTGLEPQHEEHVEKPPVAELCSQIQMGRLALRGFRVGQGPSWPCGGSSPPPRAAVRAQNSQR